MKNLKKISSLLALVLSINILITGTVSAKTLENSTPNQTSTVKYTPITSINQNYSEDGIIRAQLIPVIPVLVFVGGIAAGYIVDGVLIRYTGHSGGEWVAKALSYHRKNPGCKKIGVTKKGTTYCYTKGHF
ncbi:hypothetical protein OB894_20700 [Bacillus subtilis]|uniref:Uncharacterized protein n=1 Tax=Bacillus spizizenii TaxID=96241 RepID=A0A9Q4HFN7_BACSC|nr:hypothetical protein [Bacillus spizizenii]HAY3883935.1 hypothetical protein [Escherichia coli]MCY7842488.1 hypothetical protein [Bacillus spizizenii]MCY8122837.1 hypothetical protein [Bacillus spizizenii]MEC0564130.1 hypothetical protein [Bacillus spizizenii]